MLDTLLCLEWSKIIPSLASIITAFIAYNALNTWKEKEQANQKSKFIDIFIDEVHIFIAEIQPAVWAYKNIEISINTYNNADKTGSISNEAPYSTYITKNGVKDSEFLTTHLKKCTNHVSKIRSLLAKGQIYNFTDYHKCQDSSDLIIWQYDRLQAVASMIKNPNLHWENTEVQKTLGEALSQSSKDMENKLKENNILLLEFARKNYEKIYKKT